ncbi:hypothetical protein B0H13DRAFT_608383 [Mycena leptocephala]|nr:hypothetical protein B0H13DRAFT_608383 [Mycena leptocephala]
MHFPSTFSATIVLCAALACAAPLPMHREPEARALSRRQDIIELLQARGPISAYRRAPPLSTIQHFARANGGNACIDGALDYILALAIGPDANAAATPPPKRDTTSGSNSTDPTSDPTSGSDPSSNSTAIPPSGSSATNSADPAFVDACITEVIDWAVGKLVLLLAGDASVLGGANSGSTAVTAPSEIPSAAPSATDAPTDNSTSATSPAPSDAPAASGDPSASGTASADAPSPSDGSAAGPSQQAPSARHLRREASSDAYLKTFLTKFMEAASQKH